MGRSPHEITARDKKKDNGGDGLQGNKIPGGCRTVFYTDHNTATTDHLPIKNNTIVMFMYVSSIELYN